MFFNGPKICTLLLAFSLLPGLMATNTLCSYTPDACASPDCVRQWECGHGECGDTGGCNCHDCYEGEGCDIYVDEFGPVFVEETKPIRIAEDHRGPVIRARTSDQDREVRCDRVKKGKGGLACPCSAVEYAMNVLSPTGESPFELNTDDGMISVAPQGSLTAGTTYIIQITASSPAVGDFHHPDAVTNLTVIVESKEQSTFERGQRPVVDKEGNHNVTNRDTDGSGLYDVQSLPADLIERSQNKDVGHSREKRSSAGATSGSSTMTLTAQGTDPTMLYPGQSVTYDLKIVLPTLTTAMDLLVEIFVMDAVTGITPMALCSVQIVSVGNLIVQDVTNAAITPANVAIDLKANAQIPSVNDRAVINFGNVKNSDLSDGGANKVPSTIHIQFKASLINNPAYTNTTAIVTAGAEYDKENYVWVSQASYTFSFNPGYSYPSSISINGPDTAKEWSGATFNVDAFITDPQGPFSFEVYTPLGIHNLFTVSNIAVISFGANMMCTGVPVPSYDYYYSVDRATYHRGVAKFDMVMTGLTYPDLTPLLTNAGNKVSIVFTVFFVDAKAGDTVNVGAGISIGLTTLWTAIANVTIQPGSTVPVATGSATHTVSPIGSNRVVGASGSLTWGINIKVPPAGCSQISCTASVPANHKISGVVWGSAGANIALRPPLVGTAVTYDATLGATAWTFFLNSTGKVTGDAAADTATLEVTVTYLTTTVSPVTVTCGADSLTLDGATSGIAGTTDMSGTAEPVNLAGTNWYRGSAQAMIVKLKFPGGGVPYSNMVIETSGDFDVTAFGAKVCKVEIMKAGKGVPAIAGPLEALNDKFELKKTTTSSLFDDSVSLTVGPVAGVNRGNKFAVGDDEVVIRMALILPKNQTTITVTTYNMSLGMQLNANVIWTGWTGFATSPAAPPASLLTPLITVVPPVSSNIAVGKPTMIMVKLKTKPGSVDAYKIVASVASVTNLYICRLVLVAIGASYPCLDENPYGKELLDLALPNTIIHDPTEWGLKATLDLGVLRNLGYQDYFADGIADSDSIIVGVLVKGIAVAAAEAVTIQVLHTGPANPFTQAVPLTVALPFTPSSTLSSITWLSKDNTNVAYGGVMKIIDLVLTVPKDYSKSLVVTIQNADPVSMKLCFAAVASVGKNIPCVIPKTVLTTATDTPSLQSVKIDILETCYFPVVPGVVSENTITIRTGVQFTSTGTAGTLTAVVLEGGVAAAASPAPYAITKSATAFDPTSINTTTEGFLVELVDNTTETAHPGSSMFYEIQVILPPDTTGEVEIAAMAPTDGGRAYATIHSFRWGNTAGKNVGCLQDEYTYETLLLQNSSISVPMIHTSQTDTMVVKLGYLTNTGLSYMQNFPQLPKDNAFSLEFEVMMADHVNATNLAIIPISFAVKFADVIYVVTKNLQIVRDPALDLMVLRSELNFTLPPASTLFDRVANKKIPLTIRLSHMMNVSRQEANDAKVRVLLPRPVQFVDPDDTQNCNISYNFTNNHYLDFDITNLFFTDYLEINLTVTVDPNNDMIKGLGVIDAAALVRLVCSTFTDQTTIRYCGTTMVQPFKIDGSECYDPLNLNTMTACQFSASTAIGAGTAPNFAATGSGKVWSPAVRTGPGWNHYITIDFLKKTRVTKIEFESAGSKSVSHFKVQYSHNGLIFTAPCENVLTVVAGGTLLPPECKFEARYGRVIIVDNAPDGVAFSVRFNWYGCPIETVDDVCTPLPTTYTDKPGWRQVAWDATNSVFYFCDYSPKKQKNVCFSTKDGATWNALPAYIGSLVGADSAKGLFYAKDSKGLSTVSSKDGVNWMVTDATVAAGLTVTAMDVPGKAALDLTAVVAGGGYTADFNGINFNAASVVKWESCCS